MILDKTVKIKICSSNFKYFSSLGYQIKKLNRMNKEPQIIDVDICHLKPGSNIRLNCKCDNCDCVFTKRASQRTDFCNHCRTRITGKGNRNGSGNKGKILETMRGENHPRWNPNKTEKRQYTYLVNKASEKYDLSVLPNYDKPRGICGQEGVYQLDHIIPIQYGFDNDIDPEIIGHIKNLQFIPWELNNEKRDNIDDSGLALLKELLRGK
ncbi:hypothetical protein [Providencia phage PSTRCR_121]|nr:hypothetical protein [Providencia phage PSTRCR_121]